MTDVMHEETTAMAWDPVRKPDARFKLAKLQVLIADSDARYAQLVKSILHAFGIKKIELVSSGQAALSALRTKRVDMLITEWVMEPMGGLELVKAIRSAKQERLLRYDMPIVMLTANSAREHVRTARDSGISEFVAKPFSAKTLSARLIEVIDRPREYVESPAFCGPSRRRRGAPPIGIEERRMTRDQRLQTDMATKVTISKPSTALKDLIDGFRASDIITTDVIEEAQMEIMKVEGEFVAWVKDDVAKLETAYAAIVKNLHDADARIQLIQAAYTIKGQSGVFGYELGTHVSDLLITFVTEHAELSDNNLIVIRKHIDTMAVIFTQQVKELNSELGKSLMQSLTKLVVKFD